MSSFAMFKKVVKQINESNPMNGLIQYLLDNGYPDPIESGLVVVEEPDIFESWNSASTLIYHKEQRGYGYCGSDNYFNVSFPLFDIYVTGYGLMNNGEDDDTLINWKLECTDSSERKLIAQENNISIFTPYTYTKHSFAADTPMKCRNFRFTLVGLSTSNQSCISLAGFELFGYMGSVEEITRCSCEHNRDNALIFIYIFLLYSKQH